MRGGARLLLLLPPSLPPPPQPCWPCAPPRPINKAMLAATKKQDDEDDARAARKRRKANPGRSSLLDLLPAPQNSHAPTGAPGAMWRCVLSVWHVLAVLAVPLQRAGSGAPCCSCGWPDVAAVLHAQGPGSRWVRATALPLT